MDILTGEQIQELADVYVGHIDDFIFNPRIAQQSHKWMPIDSIPDIWNNPSCVFCYTHCLNSFSDHLHTLQNSCVLILTNSDQNVSYDYCKAVLDCQTIYHIFSQNLLFQHPKVTSIPIGIANRMWPHGNLQHFSVYSPELVSIMKVKDIFCSVNPSTNSEKRLPCLNRIKDLGIPNLLNMSHPQYLNELAQHKYCICPEGNGMDTHRFWEALYLQSIPIVIHSPFIDGVQNLGIPCICVESWDHFDPSQLPDYSTYSFNTDYYRSISLARFKNMILDKCERIPKQTL